MIRRGVTREEGERRVLVYIWQCPLEPLRLDPEQLRMLRALGYIQ